MIFKQRHFKIIFRWTPLPFLRAFLITCTLIFTFLWFSPAIVSAEKPRIELTTEEKAWLTEHPDIALGAPTNFPPFVIKRDDGAYEGALVDFLEMASHLLNHKIRLHIEDSWPNVQENAEKREIDGLAFGGKSPDRAVLYHSTEPLITTYFSAFARSQEEFQIQQFSDLDGLRIGYKSGAGPTRALLEGLPSATLNTYDDNEALTQALLSKEVDVVVAWISYDYFRKKKLQGMIDNILLINESPMDMVSHIRKDWPEFVSIMNKVIEAMREDELPTIANKWFLNWPKQTAKAPSVNLTQEEKAWLNAHPNITLGSSASYPPHTIKNTDGTYTGVLPDVYEKISQLLGTKVDVQVGKVWSEVQKKAENRELDGLAIGGRDPQRDKFYIATDRLYPSYFSVFAPSNNDLTIDRFKDLDGLRIGYKKGARPAKTRLETLPSATIVPFDNHESMTQALLSREIDVIVAWMSYDHWRKNTLQGTIDKVYLIEESPFDMVIYIRNDWPEFLPIMNKAIAALQKDELPRIIQKWFGNWPQHPPSTKVSLSPEEQAWLYKRHRVKVRIVDWPPYLIVKDNEPPQGIVIDYLKIIEERSGVRFNYEVTDQPFAEFLENMKQDQGPEMTAVIVPTPERKEFLSFSEAYISSPYVIFIREQDTPILDINGLAGKTIAVPRGFVLQQDLSNGYPEIQQLLVDSDELALQAVATGRADAYIGNLTVASHIIHKRGLSNLQVTSPSPFGEQSLSMGNRKDWPELTSIINKTLLSLTEEEKTAILSKYLAIKYEQGVDKSVILKWVLIVGVVLFCLIFLFIFWNKQLSRKVRERTSELSDSEMRFRAIFEQAAVGIAHVSPEGRFLRLNQKFCAIVGYSHDELLSLKFQDITYPEDLETDLNLVQQLHDGRKDSYSLEKRYVRKDSSIVWINLSVRVFRNDDETPRWFVSVVEDISERKEAENKALEHQKRLKLLTSQLTLAEEQERRRIAAELHDEVGQTLAFSQMQLAAVIREQDDAHLKEQLEQVSDTLLKTTQETRNLIFELSSPTMHELGLSTAISEWFEEKLQNSHGIKLSLFDMLVGDELDEEQYTIMFRNIRELLTNVIKHARASEVQVSLEHVDDDVLIKVKDNGIGFNPNHVVKVSSAEGGFGIFSIEERMSDLGGKLEITSRPHHGCTMIMSIPIFQ